MGADYLGRKGHDKNIVVADPNTKKTRKRAIGEDACRIILRRFEHRWHAVVRAFVRHHIGPIGTNHKAGCRGSDRIAFGFLKGGGAHECDRAGDPITDRMRLDIETRRRRLLVIDTQIERGNRARPIKRELDGLPQLSSSMAVTTPPWRMPVLMSPTKIGR